MKPKKRFFKRVW